MQPKLSAFLLLALLASTAKARLLRQGACSSVPPPPAARER